MSHIFTDIVFIDDRFGWLSACQPGAVFRTDDGGRSWNPIIAENASWESHHFFGVYFIDSLRGWICGEWGDEISGSLWRTQDGGKSWDILVAGSPGSGIPSGCETLTQVLFLDDRKGFILSAGEVILQTLNGGRSWKPIHFSGGVPSGLFFLDDDHRFGWLLCQDLDENYRIRRTFHYVTRDGGLSWEDNEDRFEGGIGADISACRFWDPDEGIICGPDGALFRTHDGGKTWRKLRSPSLGDLNFLHIPAGAKGKQCWMAGDIGGLWFSPDGGETWEMRHTGTEEEIHAAWFLSSDCGIIAGSGGFLARTEDAGRSFTKIQIPVDAKPVTSEEPEQGRGKKPN
jgi:photosystem II stability/assembly factor-like uncharacterized protein